MTMPTLCQPCLFFTIEAAIARKKNCNLSGIDLAAIEAHVLIIRPGKYLEI